MDERNMQSDSPDSTSLDVPIWVNGVQRWVTGLTKRTTCDDIIYALLYHDNKHEFHGTDSYAIFERWREVERPLQARTKLLKVWKAWGAEQCNVQLDMRKLDDYFLPGELSRSKRRHRRSSKHRSSRHATRSGRCCSHDNCYDTGQMKCLEGVVKLVITQERKLHDIKERIEETEQMIENLETKRHFSRIHENGEDYVQNSYLDSASDDSGSMDAFLSSIREDEVDEYLEFCDRILQLEDGIQKERNTIWRLSSRIQESGLAGGPTFGGSGSRLPDRGGVGCGGGGGVVTDVVYGSEENERCEQIQVDINRLVTANMMQRYKEEGIKKELQYFDQQISVKQQMLKSLKIELEGLDSPLPSHEETRPVGHTTASRDLELDSEDRVGQLHVHDEYPRMRTKSVTFDDTLNHMHVIGTSKENLTEHIQNTQSLVARFHNDIPLNPRPPELEKHGQNQGNRNELRVTSILKNREIVTQKQPRIDKPYINGDSYRDYKQYDNHYKTDLPFTGSRNCFLPPTMYTYANDGHYSILERSCKVSRDDNDSDTGLSSMHSDESPGLETLV
ncbi:ras association domain-containing protein 9-like isoform X2 [Gigantopelta aegis]|nr:ras association domain-containing protein 9-like isoform X2 [Gigantopelta aegis]